MKCVFVYMQSPLTDLSPSDVRTAIHSAQRANLSPVLFTNVPDTFTNEDWEIRVMSKEYMGWWCKVEMFLQDGPCLFADIDMIFMREPTQLISHVENMPETDFLMWKPRVDMLGKWWSSTFMAWNGSMKWVYDHFWERPEECMRSPQARRSKGMLGDLGMRLEQDWLQWLVRQRGYMVSPIQNYQEGVYSWKRHLTTTDAKPEAAIMAIEKPKDASVIVFHGTPRPRDVIPLNPWLVT